MNTLEYNNETVYRQMPLQGNIAKTMTSNGKQFLVTSEMFTTVASSRDQRCDMRLSQAKIMDPGTDNACGQMI